MTSERTSYRERTPWPGWVKAVFWGSITLSCYPVLAGWDTDLELTARLIWVGVILTIAVTLHILLAGLTVLVQETRIYIHFGSMPLIKKVIPFSEILALESVRYRPMMEFGGWGIRGWGKKKAWTARGDQAVVLHLPDDHRFYIGSDNPYRLEERIRTAAGDQMAGGA